MKIYIYFWQGHCKRCLCMNQYKFFKDSQNRSGFTLVEVMVVVVIMGILAAVAIPNVFGLIEKAKEKTDLAWLFYLRNAIDHQIAAHGANFSSMTGASSTGGDVYYDWNTASDWLKDKSGFPLFRVETRANKKYSAGETTYYFDIGHMAYGSAGYTSGIFYDAMNELGWGNIFKNIKNGKYYTFSGPFFTSKALTRSYGEGGVSNENRYHLRIRWASSNPNRNSVEEGKEVIVWLGTSDWNRPLRGYHGTCFSTEPKACN